MALPPCLWVKSMREGPEKGFIEGLLPSPTKTWNVLYLHTYYYNAAILLWCRLSKLKSMAGKQVLCGLPLCTENLLLHEEKNSNLSSEL